MASRILRWFFMNVVFALIPLCASISIHSFAGKLQGSSWGFCPELLFFSVMLSVTALGDLTDTARGVGNDWLFVLACGVLALSAVWSALMYGVYLYANISGPVPQPFQGSLFTMSVCIAISVFILSAFAEILVSRIRKV